MFTPKDFVHRLKMLATITLSPPQRSVRLQRGSKESVGLQGPTVSVRFMSFQRRSPSDTFDCTCIITNI